MVKTKKAIKQLNFLKKNSEKMRLASESWNTKWKTLIVTILSAQNRDEKTIPISKKLFNKFPSLKKLASADLNEIKKIIKPINYYKTKAKHIKETAKIINKKGIPSTREKLTELPGVGRKTANVYLTEKENKNAIAVDTHVKRISQKLNWTTHKKPDKIESDLEELFPKKYWKKINPVLVRFGKTHTKKKEDEVIEKMK